MQKKTIIKKIKAIIEKHGTGGEYDKSITAADMQLNASPVISSVGKNTFQLAETFGLHKVTAVIYVHDREESEDYIAYEELEKDVLEEILFNLENYEVDEF